MIQRSFWKRFATKLTNSPSLFSELLSEIRTSQVLNTGEAHRKPSDAILKLTQQELEITRGLFHKLSEIKTSTETGLSRETEETSVDPYWDPFNNRIATMKEQLKVDFQRYSDLAADEKESKRTKIQIKKALRESKELYDSYSIKNRKYFGQTRSPTQSNSVNGLKLSFDAVDKITFKDVDILQHLRTANGCILPRRMTGLSKAKHQQATKAIKIAQKMALIPMKNNNFQALPLIDPYQWMVDRLVMRIERERLLNEGEPIAKSDLDRKISSTRAKAMLKVMMTDVAPNLDYSKFLEILSSRKSEI
jgi:ribosomal protein S18